MSESSSSSPHPHIHAPGLVNGNVARLAALEKASEHMQEEIAQIHSRINDLKGTLDTLIGQLTAVKWLIGAGFVWLLLQEVAVRVAAH